MRHLLFSALPFGLDTLLLSTTYSRNIKLEEHVVTDAHPSGSTVRAGANLNASVIGAVSIGDTVLRAPEQDISLGGRNWIRLAIFPNGVFERNKELWGWCGGAFESEKAFIEEEEIAVDGKWVASVNQRLASIEAAIQRIEENGVIVTASDIELIAESAKIAAEQLLTINLILRSREVVDVDDLRND